MSEQNADAATGTDAGKAPVFRLEKIYIKDLSFESPNAPEAFFLREPEHKVEMNLKMTHKQVDENHWEVCLEIAATVSDTKSGKVVFILEVEHAGAFLLQNIPEEHMQQVLNVDCPTVLFPFTRQIATQASVDGGFPPFFMEPINFVGMYQSKLQKQQEQKEKAN
jgi:preprotein translocase subunit SecB